MNTRYLRLHLSEGGIALFDLSGRTRLQLTGVDRVRYLNGQVSNDMRHLTRLDALPACVMTAKGKMNAFVWISADSDSIFVDADAELRESLAARLERYIISDDVTLTDFSDDCSLHHLIGLSREQADAIAQAYQSDPTTADFRFVHSRRFGIDGVDVIAPLGKSFTVGSPEGAASLEVDAETAETFRIEQGIPRWGMELNENTIPVEAGLESIAIDYHKGCYLGQEVISRIKSVGHVNRHLCGIASEHPLAAGMALFSGDREAGVLTSAGWSDAFETYIALGYLKRGNEGLPLFAHRKEAEAEHAATPFPVEIHSLPFVL